eukprot:scaffold2052_cov106-Isochrysis_galbana.AAC.3
MKKSYPQPRAAHPGPSPCTCRSETGTSLKPGRGSITAGLAGGPFRPDPNLAPATPPPGDTGEEGARGA